MEPRLIMELRWGPMNGRKVSIPAGSSLRVGRTDMADLELAYDKHLSKVHFSLDWDGSRCLLRDLDSQEGTLVDGEALKEGEVSHGGWIRAGETDFSVHIEDKIPPREDDNDPDDDELYTEDERWVRAERRAEEAKRLEAAGKALTALREEAAKEPLFAILDAARSDRILELLKQSVEPHQSLYEGIQGEPLSTVAPYLVGPFREDSKLLDRLVMEGWGRRWGIYVTSREPFKEVRRHFRRFLMVEFEDTEERVYFRFYDPWVMQVFFPTCAERQKQELMSGCIALFAEDKSGQASCLQRLEDRA